MEADEDRFSTLSRRYIPAVQFGFWFFAFMLLESFVNSSVAALLGAQVVNLAYSVGIFFTATGLLAFGLSHTRWADTCKAAIPAAAVVCCVATLGVACLQNAALLTLASCAALLSCGFIGGWVHLELARAFGKKHTCGRVIGAVTGSVVCVQFLVQNLTQGAVPVVACIIASLALLAALVFHGSKATLLSGTRAGMPEDTESGARTDAAVGLQMNAAGNVRACISSNSINRVVTTANKRTFVCTQNPACIDPQVGIGAGTSADESVRAWPQDTADKQRHGTHIVIAAAILTIIFALNDSVVVSLDASGSLQLFSGVRLFYALGLVAAGCLYDLGPRFSFTFTTVAMQIMAVLVPYFLWMPEWYNLNMALFYFYGGFYVMFVTAEFVVFSDQMANSALWAGLGRMTRSYATALSVIPISLLYAKLGVVALVAAGVILNMALLAVCVADAQLLAHYRLPELQLSQDETSVRPVVDFDRQDVDRFAQGIGLTDREREVLVLMVTTEDENQKMADDLGISRRTLQRHIAQVYEKAGVQSRIGLYKAVAAHASGRMS